MSASVNPASNAERPHFVWLLTATGAQAQKWAILEYGERDWLKPYVVASHPLAPNEAGLSLDELSRRYPLYTEKQQHRAVRH